MPDTEITQVDGLRVWDSRGRPTVEAHVRLACGAVGRGIAPAGASTGSAEAIELRDGGQGIAAYGVDRAVTNVNDEISMALRGQDAADQTGVDQGLIELDGTPNKARLGANATVAVSMAVANAVARAHGRPLYHLLGGDTAVTLPLPEVQIFGGGAHAGRRVDIQDFLIVCPGATSFAEAIEWTAEVYHAAGALMLAAGKLAGVADEGGYWPDFDSNEAVLDALTEAIARAGFKAPDQVAIALDIAASEFGRSGRYQLSLDQRELSTGEMIDQVEAWLSRFPIVSIEDPLSEDDFDGFAALTARAGAHTQIVGDDLLVTDADRVRRAAELGAANTVLLKPNQRGTLTETRAAWDAAREVGYSAIMSARSGETEDVTIVHIAVGWGIPQLKVGSFARSERMAKWNEALRIEAQLGARAGFAGRHALPVEGANE